MFKQPEPLKLSLKIKLSETQQQNNISYQLGAFITSVEFNGISYKPETGEFIASPKMAEIGKKVAVSWLSSIEVAKGNQETNIMEEIKFEAALPSHLSPNIAICYNNKFRKNNDLKEPLDEEKLQRARTLEGKIIEIALYPQDLQLLIPVDAENTEQLKKVRVCDKDRQEVQIKTVPLTSYNKGSNLESIQLSGKNAETFLDLATEVVGDKVNAAPTNAQNQLVPFSMTLAKMPNFLLLVKETLEKENVESSLFENTK
jgi:hypothetical protein